ncbi:MAG: Muramoyltetrapeptide carboxypeptidase [Polaromonas sp.]|nr:Muramoyltetrapeptide carboxypeptidase [Polaromonas sp.]
MKSDFLIRLYRNGILASVKKHIYIYSPSSAVQDKVAFKRGLKRLTAIGYEVEVDETALTTHQRFAGDDETRLAAIHRAASSGADVALISRGGYGLTRILHAIDYKAVANAIAKGTQFVGFSDFTAFQMALLAKTGAVTWAGPALGEDFGAQAGADDIMEACFDDLVTGQGEGSGWQLPKSAINSIAASASDASASALKDAYNINNAVLWGGNLAMLASLVGTPYMPVITDGILFIEDVGEHPYRVERMLAQLLQAGILAKQKAIIFGQFSNYKLVPHDKGYKLASVVSWLQSQVNAKVLTGLPFGHVATKVLLPVGLPLTLAVEGRDAFLLWGHQH